MPAAFALLCLGLGLLIESAAGLRVPLLGVVGLGLAALVTIAVLLTLSGTSARWTPVACAALALVGLVIGRDRLRLRPAGRWRYAAPAVLTYCLYVLPCALAGQLMPAGYGRLDDSAVWLALTDQVMARGATVGEMTPSTYSLTLHGWLDGGYPTGSFVLLGVPARLVGADLSLAYQPMIAARAAVAALGFFESVRDLVPGRWAGWCAVLAVQASLFFGYAMWGGLKEVATVAVLAQTGWVVRATGRSAVVGAVVTSAGLLAVLGLAGLAWAVPLLVLAVGRVVVRTVRRPEAHANGRTPSLIVPALLVVAVGLAAFVPIWSRRSFVQNVTGVLVSDDLGNLAAPLPLLQGAGIWPLGDFRYSADVTTPFRLLAGLCVVGAAVGVVLAARHRRVALPSAALVTGIGAAAAVLSGSPWVDAKALAIVSPFVLLACAAAVAQVTHRSRAVAASAGGVAALVLTAAVVVSSAMVIGSSRFGSRDSIDELVRINDDFAGEGPAVLLSYDAYADRYYLRDLDADGATDLRVREIPALDGSEFAPHSNVDSDQVDSAALAEFNLVVQRRSPASSRPPSAFEMRFAGELWEVWQRGSGPWPLARLPLGSGADPAAAPECDDVRRLAEAPGATQLVAAPRASSLFASQVSDYAPSGWIVQAPYVVPQSSGTLEVTAHVERAGTYRVWVGGTAAGILTVRVDGEDVGAVHHRMAVAGDWIRFDTVPLTPGSHEVRLDYDARPYAGTRATDSSLGPVALTLEEPDSGLVTVPVAQAESLCDGRTFDWVEAVP